MGQLWEWERWINIFIIAGDCWQGGMCCVEIPDDITVNNILWFNDNLISTIQIICEDECCYQESIFHHFWITATPYVMCLETYFPQFIFCNEAQTTTCSHGTVIYRTTESRWHDIYKTVTLGGCHIECESLLKHVEIKCLKLTKNYKC